jgi:DNA-binding NarL/FixJ family response regulator
MNFSSTYDFATGKDTITRRETEILYLVSQGKSNKEIATCLHISLQTVQKHTKNIYRKLDVHNKIEALNKTRWLIASLFNNRN